MWLVHGEEEETRKGMRRDIQVLTVRGDSSEEVIFKLRPEG